MFLVYELSKIVSNITNLHILSTGNLLEIKYIVVENIVCVVVPIGRNLFLF